MKKRRLLMGALAVILLLCAAQAGRKLYENAVRAREYEEAAVIAGLPPAAQGSGPSPALPGAEGPDAPETASPEPAASPEETVRSLENADLEALRAVNPEVVGWIEIPGTAVSYPVLWSGDNAYYLNHTWTGAPNSGGAIFLEQTNTPDLTDFHTILYGHRMRNGSMFGSLPDYRDASYWQEHPSVYLALDGGVYRYDVFAACEAGVTGLVYRLDLEESGLEEAFLQACMEQSVIDTGIVPEAGARILTLSTCTGNGYDTRWVVQCVLADRAD